MASTNWNGLGIEGTVDNYRGSYEEPAWIEVEIETYEMDDEEEFAQFLEEHEKPAEWKDLRKECIDWIESKYEDEISDKLAEDFFASDGY